jgi:hypothetical protein
VLRLSRGVVTPQCPPPSFRPVTAHPVQFVVLSSQGRGAVPACAGALQPVLVTPNRQQILWGYRLALPVEPASTFPARLAQAAERVCPGLAALMPA